MRAFTKDMYAALLRPGDRVQLVTKDGYSPDALLRIVSVKPAVATEAERSLWKSGLASQIVKGCNTLLEVVFDRADPVLRPGSLFVSMDAAGSGFRVENCRFGPNRARGGAAAAGRRPEPHGRDVRNGVGDRRGARRALALQAWRRKIRPTGA